MSTSRLGWIDIARGLGIILMVYGHTSRGIDKAGITFAGFNEIDTVIYSFHMPLFFALSGYFFRKSLNKGTKAYLYSKAATILYPYLLWSFIQVLIQFGTSHLINSEATWHEVVTFYYPRGQYWFLFGLLIIDILNLFLYKYLKENGLIISTIISLVVIVFSIDLGLLNLAVNNIIYFNFGVLLSYSNRFTHEVLNSRKWTFIVLFIFVFLEVALLRIGLPLPLTIVLALIGTTFIFQLSKKMDGPAHLASLGKNSMIIFLMHTIVSAAIRIVLQKILHIENVAVHLILGFFGGLYVPYLLYQYFPQLIEPLFIFPTKKSNPSSNK